VLGVSRTASLNEIKRAYRRLLVTAHPDKGGSAEEFQQLKAAFAQLSDPAERLLYDEWLGVDPCSSIDGTSNEQQALPDGQVFRRSGGVTVVVHGQTQGSPRLEQQTRSIYPEAACPAQCSSNEQLQQATANLQRLNAAGGTSACLAEAYVLRAQLRRAAGQPHHALFDAEEALRLDSGNQEAALLVLSLHSDMQDAERLNATSADECSEAEDDMGCL
jgi:curved DNA-binding protein CbpA